MRTQSDWKLGTCIAAGIAVILLLPPSMESVFYGSIAWGIIVVGVRVVLGVVLGACAYLLLFGNSNARR
jgi:hypothetical protein